MLQITNKDLKDLVFERRVKALISHDNNITTSYYQFIYKVKCFRYLHFDVYLGGHTI
jgi:hypothetical protein